MARRKRSGWIKLGGSKATERPGREEIFNRSALRWAGSKEGRLGPPRAESPGIQRGAGAFSGARATGAGTDLGIRTDLAIEAREIVAGRTGAEIPGVATETEQLAGALVTRVAILTEEAERLMGKVRGNYVTIESQALKTRDRQLEKEISRILARELEKLASRHGLSFKEGILTLVTGLGNWQATPDAVGPETISRILVTRHLFNIPPREQWEGFGKVCAISPGVLGLTGIETAEIIQGVVEKVGPNLVIVVDALASRSVSRVGTTIQMGDTGIQPGSGVGNRRFGITRESLGVPVIAIGVPTVVEAITIVSDAMDILTSQPPQGVGTLGAWRQALGTVPSGTLSQQQRRQLLYQVLAPYMGALIVTPKEVDTMVKELATVIAGGLNLALHPGLAEDEAFDYLQ